MAKPDIASQNGTVGIDGPFVARARDETYTYFACEECGAECVAADNVLHEPGCSKDV
jgi:hypothetical protein